MSRVLTMQVVQQTSGPVHPPAVLGSTTAGAHSAAAPKGSEHQNELHEQQQHVVDQLNNLSFHGGKDDADVAVLVSSDICKAGACTVVLTGCCA